MTKQEYGVFAKIDSIKTQTHDLSSICELLAGICNSDLVEENYQYLYIMTTIIKEKSIDLKNLIDEVIN